MNHLRYYIPDTWVELCGLNEEARSKAQRRLFAMALAYKRGKLDSKYVSDDVKKLSRLDVGTLEDFARTNEKRRRKDGSVGERDKLDHYSRDGKGFDSRSQRDEYMK